MKRGRPRPGTQTGRVWELADEMTLVSGAKAKRSEVVARFVEEGGNAGTASTQYGLWSRSMDAYVEPAGSKLAEAVAEPAGKANQPELVKPFKPDWKVLLKNGFTYTSDWLLGNDSTLSYDRPPPDAPGVYVFVVNDEVVYVGVTSRKLAQRMNDYRLGHPGQKTSSRVKKLIAETLEGGTTVSLLCAVPADSTWNGLPVVIAEGLEAGLIRKFQPKWNKSGLGSLQSS